MHLKGRGCAASTLCVMRVLIGISIIYGVAHDEVALALEPAPNEEIRSMRDTGEFPKRLDFAKSLGNHKVDSFVLKRAILKQQRKFLQDQHRSMEEINRVAPLPAPPPAWQGMPSTGNVRAFALLIEFSDVTHTNSQTDIHSKLFGEGNSADSPYESLARYYSRASYNQLDLRNGTTLGWYQTGYPRSSVPQTTTGRENLIKEALNHFDAQGHDFSQYDNNGDGAIDYFIVIWTGPENGWGNFWWGYQPMFTDTSYMLDGVRLRKYSWQWESLRVGAAFNPQVVIHETGHALGLPDYYDYDASIGPKGGVGGLDMMDANQGDHGCFSKWMLEWVTPTIVASGALTKSMSASGNSPDCVIIWPGMTTGDLFSEFFAVQNRHRVGNDDASGMPGDGMLIWHIDAKLTADGTTFAYNNSFTEHKLIKLMEADGLEEIETGARANSGDYYAVGRQFGPATSPASSRYDGSRTSITVSNLSPVASKMSVTFQIGDGPPSAPQNFRIQ